MNDPTRTDRKVPSKSVPPNLDDVLDRTLTPEQVSQIQQEHKEFVDWVGEKLEADPQFHASKKRIATELARLKALEQARQETPEPE